VLATARSLAQLIGSYSGVTGAMGGPFVRPCAEGPLISHKVCRVRSGAPHEPRLHIESTGLRIA
jgi:hypothetical protein